PPPIPAGAPHTCVDYKPPGDTTWDSVSNQVQVLVAWEPAGSLRNAPADSYGGTQLPALIATGGRRFRPGSGKSILVEDGLGNGALGSGSVLESDPRTLQDVSVTTAGLQLRTPLQVMENVIHLTRGKKVDPEFLGIGDATIAGQEFTLA